MAEDESEGMAVALGRVRIGHRHEAVEQVRVLCRVGRPSSGELAQAGWAMMIGRARSRVPVSCKTISRITG